MEITKLTCFRAISRLWLDDTAGTMGWSAEAADGMTSTEKLQR